MHPAQASSPGTLGDPHTVHAAVHVQHAICPSMRTGSTGNRPHIGQVANTDGTARRR